MMTPRDEVAVLAADLAAGTSSSGVLCPFCGGGRNKERSMSITRRKDGVVLYICHRASCGIAGRLNSLNYNAGEEKQGNFIPTIFQGETRKIEFRGRVFNELRANWLISEEDVSRFGLKEIIGSPPRLFIPIYDNRGTFVGSQSRKIFKYDKFPKTINYKEKEGPQMGWFVSSEQRWESPSWKNVLLVEDVVSAMRAADFIPAVALLGCNLSLEKLMEILKVTDDIYLALDRDATGKALAFQRMYSFVAPEMKVIPLDYDLKNLADKQIEEKLRLYGAIV